MSEHGQVHLRTWDSLEKQAKDVPLTLSDGASVELRCLPGACAIHLVLSNDDGVLRRAEVAATPGEIVPLHVELDEDGAPSISSHGRDLLLLPPDVRYEPASPISPRPADIALDLALVVDGTLLDWSNDAAPVRSRLLDNKDAWAMHAEELLRCIARLTDGRDARAVLLAFGDQELPFAAAPDLQPRYHIHPPADELALRLLDLARLRQSLLSLSSTPGGDYVDALADALGVCERLHWRDEARKLVIVTGDSPGASLLCPLPAGADVCVRRNDVETRAAGLHRRGVEIITIHHGPADADPTFGIVYQRELLVAAQAQYRRIASVPEFHYSGAAFDGQVAADALRGMDAPMAKGAALGELVSMTAMNQ